MTADDLCRAISTAISESLCNVFEVVGILEAAKQDVLMAALEDSDEEGEEDYEVVGE